ncbi:hypothetical protein O6H91_Y294600 [Diphasiastrum complanatum]|nr:hypothetical protein O6H91_Y294600 [Diphasiastrum complanatum]
MALKLALSIEREQQRILQENTNPNVVNQKYEVSFTDKVIELHARCGLELDSSLGTLQMLTNIEAKLEENIATLAEIPQEFIEQTEKSREKERRLKVREERFQRQREEQERRAQRSLERAQAPIHKRVGKQPMFRSRLFKLETEKVQVIKNDDDKELAEFLARDF